MPAGSPSAEPLRCARRPERQQACSCRQHTCSSFVRHCAGVPPPRALCTGEGGRGLALHARCSGRCRRPPRPALCRGVLWPDGPGGRQVGSLCAWVHVAREFAHPACLSGVKAGVLWDACNPVARTVRRASVHAASVRTPARCHTSSPPTRMRPRAPLNHPSSSAGQRRFWPVRKYPWGSVEAMLTQHSGA